MDQPTGIALSDYLAAWPSLAPIIDRLNAAQSAAVQADLRQRAPALSDDEWNLRAQLAWQRGALDEADVAAASAVALRPAQPLNAFQQAMVDFAHLRRASGMLDQWKWQQRTRDAYQRTFDLDPHNLSARYYLASSYMNTPWIGGGDTKKALALSQGGIALGQAGFYVVRADAHRLRGDLDAANADYDTAIESRAFKLSGFLDAAREEMGCGHWDRSKRYLDWALYCRPDSTGVWEELGDYYLATRDPQQALRSYQTAVQRDQNNESARKKLANLGH
jgi:tetratricopeptide (TPR) repeat protein